MQREAIERARLKRARKAARRLEDATDAAIADACLADIDAHPERVIRGEELERQLRELLVG